jgi:hypothetical protein
MENPENIYFATIKTSNLIQGCKVSLHKIKHVPTDDERKWQHSTTQPSQGMNFMHYFD